MAIEKKPSIYSDRSSIGSAEELDEYGVWVKSEPQVLSTISSGNKETFNLSPAIKNETPDEPSSEDFLDDDFSIDDTSDDTSNDTLMTGDTSDDLSSDDSTSDDFSDEDFSDDDFISEITDDDDDNNDSSADMSPEFDDFDFPGDNVEKSDVIDEVIDNIEDVAEGDALSDIDGIEDINIEIEDDLQFSETAESPKTDNTGTDDIIDDGADDFLITNDEIIADKATFDLDTPVDTDNNISSPEESSYEVPTVQSISGGNTAKIITDNIETNIVNIQENNETIIQKKEPDLSTQLLLKIANELSSIRGELSELKKEFSIVRSSAPQEHEHEIKEAEPQIHEHSGFFSEEEDETIALTGDELDNILNTANFTEESGATETPENVFSAGMDDTGDPLAETASLDDFSISSLDMDDVKIDAAEDLQSIVITEPEKETEEIEEIKDIEIEAVEFDSIIPGKIVTNEIDSGAVKPSLSALPAVSDDVDDGTAADALLSDLEYDDDFAVNDNAGSEESEASAETSDEIDLSNLTAEDEFIDVSDLEIDDDSDISLDEETPDETDETEIDISQIDFSDDIVLSKGTEELHINEAMYLDDEEADAGADEEIQFDEAILMDDIDLDESSDEDFQIDEVVFLDDACINESLKIDESADLIENNDLAGDIDISDADLADNIDISETDLAGDIEISGADLADNIEISNADLADNIEISDTDLAGDIDISNADLADNIEISDADLADSIDISDADLADDIVINETVDFADDIVINETVDLADDIDISDNADLADNNDTSDSIDSTENIDIDESKDSDELKTLREEGVQPVTCAPENSSYLEEENNEAADAADSLGFDADEFDSDPIDLSDAIIDEPVLSTEGIDEPVTEPEIDLESIEDIDSLNDFNIENTDEEESQAETDDDLDADTQADEEISFDAAAEDNLDIDLSAEDDSEIDEDTGDDLDIDIPTDDLVIDDIQDQIAAYPDDNIEQVIPEGFETEIEETPVSFDDDLEEEITAENIDITPDIPGEVPDTAAETEKTQSVSQQDTVKQEAAKTDNFEFIPRELKSELRNILSYMDQLLDSLPEEKIEEFAKSEYFDSYKRLFKELGLV